MLGLGIHKSPIYEDCQEYVLNQHIPSHLCHIPSLGQCFPSLIWAETKWCPVLVLLDSSPARLSITRVPLPRMTLVEINMTQGWIIHVHSKWTMLHSEACPLWSLMQISGLFKTGSFGSHTFVWTFSSLLIHENLYPKFWLDCQVQTKDKNATQTPKLPCFTGFWILNHKSS